MDRPNIYLDAPIKLHGIEVRHTRPGLVYLIDHYQEILKIAKPIQLNDPGRQHIAKLIENYKIHLTLYDKQ